MGMCASQDAKPAKGRNTKRDNRHGKGGGGRNGGRGAKGKRNRRHSTSESSSETETDDDSEEEDVKPTNKRDVKKHQDAPSPTPKQLVDTNNNYPPVPNEDLDMLFYKAFTCRHFAPTAVPQELLRTAMKLALLAPTAYNCCPMRVIFCTTPESKEKLITTLDEKNVRQAKEAPVIAIVCTDDKYTHYLPRLMPYVPNAQQMFEQYEDLNEMIKIRNSNLQAGYLILALRSLNLGVGPLSGFDNAACERLFLANTTWKSNILLCIGYPDQQRQPAQPQRAYRLPFEVAAKLIH